MLKVVAIACLSPGMLVKSRNVVFGTEGLPGHPIRRSIATVDGYQQTGSSAMVLWSQPCTWHIAFDHRGVAASSSAEVVPFSFFLARQANLVIAIALLQGARSRCSYTVTFNSRRCPRPVRHARISELPFAFVSARPSREAVPGAGARGSRGPVGRRCPPRSGFA